MLRVFFRQRIARSTVDAECYCRKLRRTERRTSKRTVIQIAHSTFCTHPIPNSTHTHSQINFGLPPIFGFADSLTSYRYYAPSTIHHIRVARTKISTGLAATNSNNKWEKKNILSTEIIEHGRGGVSERERENREENYNNKIARINKLKMIVS